MQRNNPGWKLICRCCAGPGQLDGVQQGFRAWMPPSSQVQQLPSRKRSGPGGRPGVVPPALGDGNEGSLGDANELMQSNSMSAMHRPGGPALHSRTKQCVRLGQDSTSHASPSWDRSFPSYTELARQQVRACTDQTIAFYNEKYQKWRQQKNTLRASAGAVFVISGTVHAAASAVWVQMVSTQVICHSDAHLWVASCLHPSLRQGCKVRRRRAGRGQVIFVRTTSLSSGWPCTWGGPPGLVVRYSEFPILAGKASGFSPDCQILSSSCWDHLNHKQIVTVAALC